MNWRNRCCEFNGLKWKCRRRKKKQSGSSSHCRTSYTCKKSKCINIINSLCEHGNNKADNIGKSIETWLCIISSLFITTWNLTKYTDKKRKEEEIITKLVITPRSSCSNTIANHLYMMRYIVAKAYIIVVAKRQQMQS